MARLDDYNKNELDKMAEQDNGYQMIDQAEKKAKRGLKNALMEATGINHLKRLVKQGLKAGAKAAFKALGKGLLAILKFLVSNPVGWVILAVLLALLLLHSCSDKDADTSAWFSTESDDEVALLLSDCPSVNKDVGATGATEGQTEENAKKIYSVFKSFGLTDEQIAGMLGNYSEESGIDSTGIEGIYDEPFTIGTRKTNALADISKYTVESVFSLYSPGFINQDAYRDATGSSTYCCGMGLPQWTGPAGKTLLDTAPALGVNWYDFDYQLAFMVGDSLYRKDFFKNWKNCTCGCKTDARQAAYDFTDRYEGNTGSKIEERKDAAARWLTTIKSWSVDETYVGSILALASSMGNAVEATGSAQDAKKCGVKNNSVDNSSAAKAAVSYAYATKDEGKGNNGTQLYQAVHDGVFPGDRYYQSCDRGVACAIVWSGTDIEYKRGDTSEQHEYLRGSPKWKLIGTSEMISYEELQPGDVFIRSTSEGHGHTIMFVGKEIVHEIHPDAAADSDSVSASFEERSPGCGNDATGYLSPGGDSYDIYRCIVPDNSDQYKDIGANIATN